MDRRSLLGGGVALAAFARAKGLAAGLDPAGEGPQFRTADQGWQAAYDKALAVLAGNVQLLPRYSRPVLIEGSVYQGIWLECAPHEALVYRKVRPDVARQTHLAFFALQRADGQLPANNKVAETGFGQIQMVVPIAATAWELARATGDGELLEAAYRGSALWEGWLKRYRDTRGTGLVEAFCTFDTGMDNSPRWKGVADQCPNKDAKYPPPSPSVPRLAPDLSATSYGARTALSRMARALGRVDEADRWAEDAERLRGLILQQLYDAGDAAFYDRDPQGRFVKIRCDILSRICGEHVPDRALFDRLWQRQLHDPRAFWAPFPLPSVALDDPAFVRPIPRNSWGGASQALTALRAGRWMEHYGRAAEFATLMERWCAAIRRDPSLRQQIDPLTGAFTQEDAPNYSPAALVMMDFTWRLAGVREEGEELHWTVRPGHPATREARFAVRTDAGAMAEMTYGADGAELRLGGRVLGRMTGGTARLVTDATGRAIRLVGVAEEPQHVRLALTGRPPRSLALKPNAVMEL